MKRLTSRFAVVFCFVLLSSLAFAQTFPPVWQPGPFPTGTETVRNDAPANTSIPDELGTLYEYTAYRGTPEIDGVVNGDPVWGTIPWTAMSIYTVNGGVTCNIFTGDSCASAVNYGGAEDISAYFKILWDDDNVYFALYKVDESFVSDTTHANDLGSIWQDDAYQIVLDANAPNDIGGALPSAEIGLALLGSISNDMAFTETAYNSWRNTNGDPLELADGDGSSTIEVCDGKAFFGTLTPKHVGYTEVMEVAFKKWDAIVADTPQMFSIMANDPDAGHPVDALQWAQGIFDVKLPERYASIVYSSSEPPEDPNKLIDITDLGGTIVGSNDDEPWTGPNSDGSPDKERIEKLIDNDVNTKYLVGAVESWIDYEIDELALISAYTITSANDVPTRDPATWELMGWDETANEWVYLHDVYAEPSWEKRFMTKTWTFANTDKWFKKFRLEIIEINEDPEGLMQMAELELLGKLASAVEDKAPIQPTSFALEQNYPNPFNPTTTISYAIQKTGNVELKVYDLLGQEVATLVNNVQNPGNYSVTFDANDLSSGVYIYTLKSAGSIMSHKMILMK
ncbi:T9SS type A sorting domain-containing protein [candidate division KSB1 bacterium]|nr:T9SS type A sorting domain-containing protein [candidate division KSB1 bacterium]